MKRVVLLTATLAMAAAVVPAAAAGKPCRPMRDVLPTGVQVAWAVKIRADETPCRFARRLPEKWIRFVRYGETTPEMHSKAALGIKGWRCRDAGTNGGWRGRVSCRDRDGARVSWRLSEHRE